MPSCGIGKKPFGDTKFQDISASPGVSAAEHCKIRAGEVHEIIGIWALMIDMKPLYILVVVFFCFFVFLAFWWGFFLILKYCSISSMLPKIKNFHFLPVSFLETPTWLIQIQSVWNILNLFQKNIVHFLVVVLEVSFRCELWGWQVDIKQV